MGPAAVPRFLSAEVSVVEETSVIVGANVLAGLVGGDGKTGLSWDIKMGTGFHAHGGLFAIELHRARPLGDLHAFRFLGGEVVFAGKDNTEAFRFAVLGGDRVGDDFAIEVDLGNGRGGHVGKFHDDWMDKLTDPRKWFFLK